MTARLRTLMLLLALSFSTSALAFNNYQDMWWQPSESGWGLMVLQQGGTLSAVLFHYRPDRKPVWYLLSNAPRNNGEVYTGTLYEVNGPPLFTAFDPATVNARNAGTMTLDFASLNAGTLAYTIDGQTTSKAIERINFAAPDAQGTYLGSQTAVITCSGNPAIGSSVIPARFTVAAGMISRVELNNTLLNTGSATCDWMGTYQQHGSGMQANGSYVCRNALSAVIATASFEIEDLRVIDHAVAINYRATVSYPTAGATCSERGLLSGTRLQNPN